MIKDIEGFRRHAESVHKCTRCGLHEQCQSKMVCAGNPNGYILFVMDSPRPEELEHQRPLCYQDGLYLQKHLGLAGFVPGDAMVAYCVCCPIEPFRMPVESEYGPCFTHLWNTIVGFDPKLIIPVGTLPTRVLCKSNRSVSALQGSVQKLGKYRIFPIVHPNTIRTQGSRLQIKQYIAALREARKMVFE